MVWKEGVLLWASIVCMFRGCYGLLERSSLIVKYDPFSRLEKQGVTVNNMNSAGRHFTQLEDFLFETFTDAYQFYPVLLQNV